MARRERETGKERPRISPDSIVRLDCLVIQWIPRFSHRRENISWGIVATRFQSAALREKIGMLIDTFIRNALLRLYRNYSGNL